MKKIFILIIGFLAVLTACKTYSSTPEINDAMNNVYNEVDSQEKNYSYLQIAEDNTYDEKYNAENRSYDVIYKSTSEKGDLKITYTSYIDNDEISNLEVYIDDKLDNDFFTEEQLDPIVKTGSELFEIHEQLLSTYVDNFNSDIEFKKISEDDNNYLIEGKTVENNNVHIELSKDQKQFKLVDQTNQMEQQIIVE